MEERIKKLEQEVQTLKNIAWVIGVLAVIFGLSGGWGLTALLSAKNELDELNTNVAALQGNTTTIKEHFTKIRKTQEKDFSSHVENKKKEFDIHVHSVAAEVNAKTTKYYVEEDEDLPIKPGERFHYNNIVITEFCSKRGYQTGIWDGKGSGPKFGVFCIK